MINIFSKVSGHKINIHKPIAFLYSKNEQAEEIRKMIPFIIVSKKSRVNLTKEVTDFYNKNDKTLRKEAGN
jgi:septin family protein